MCLMHPTYVAFTPHVAISSCKCDVYSTYRFTLSTHFYCSSTALNLVLLCLFHSRAQ